MALNVKCVLSEDNTSCFACTFYTYSKALSFSESINFILAVRQSHFHKVYILHLTLVMLDKLRCHIHFKFSDSHITWSRLLIQIHFLIDKQCRSRSVGFWRSQLIWICTVCKSRIYPGSAGQGLMLENFSFIKCMSLLLKLACGRMVLASL